MNRWGISVAISEFLVVSIAIIFTAVVVAYVIGVWHQQEAEYSIVPSVYFRERLNGDSIQPILRIHINNKGNKELVFIRIEVRIGSGSWVNMSKWIIRPGESKDIVISRWIWTGNASPPDLKVGDKCRVVIFTENFGVLFYDVIVS